MRIKYRLYIQCPDQHQSAFGACFSYFAGGPLSWCFCRVQGTSRSRGDIIYLDSDRPGMERQRYDGS